MRKFFENPEMTISIFDVENVVTTGSGLTPSEAKNAIEQGQIKLAGMNDDGTANAAATAIFSFNE